MAVRFSPHTVAMMALSALLAACTTHKEQTSTNVQIIKDNSGGQLLGYAMTSLRFRESGSMVSFNGFCDSACTLLLGLPEEQLCLNRGASFGFHLPYGSTPQSNRTAAEFLYSQYPEWVRDWISEQGGLKSRIKRMNFKTASAHIKLCSDDDDVAPASSAKWIEAAAVR